MKPTPYDDDKHDEPPLYLRLVSANNGLSVVAAKLIIVDADGEPVDRGNVLLFDDDGRAFAASIDPDAARRAGLTTDDKGRLEFRS